MPSRRFKDGEIIFREGDPSDTAYVVESGTVELTKASDREPVQLALLRKGEMFGEMGILDGSARSATATAVGKVSLKVLPRDVFLETLEKEPDMARSVIAKLVERLRHADDLLVQQRSAQETVSRLRRDPSRPARPGLFRRLIGDTRPRLPRIEIRVAALDGEQGEDYARAVAALLDRHKRVRARALKEPLPVDPERPPLERLTAAAEAGRQWLAQTGADLLIWGEVPEPGATLHLRFVPAVFERADRPGTFSPGTTLTLPATLPPEFGDILLAVSLAAAVPADEAREATLAEALPEALEAALPLIQDMPADLTSKERGAVLTCFGNAVATVAGRTNSVEMYQVASHAYKAALEGLSRDQAPVEWALTQKHLGCVLQVLAERTNDAEAVSAAANVFRSALEVLDRQAMPFDWACTQFRLGQSLYRLDLKTGDTEFLKESLAALQNALQVFGRQDDPLRWAEIRNTLAQVAQVLGRELRNPELLEKACEACDSALEVRTRGEHPLLYAATQNNLGSALFLLGRMTGNKGYYQEAATAFREACDTYRAEDNEKLAAIAERNLHHVEEVLPQKKDSRRPAGPPAWFEEDGD